MTKTNIHLDFLVIGAQKCATTWLFECLSDHPEICMPKHKREIEYIGGDLYIQKGLNWYLSLLDHCTDKKVKGDVSVEYIMNAQSPELLYDLNPKMKFILSVRDPAERAISALKWYIRKGIISDDQAILKKDLVNEIGSFSLLNNASGENKLHDVLHRGMYNELLKPYYKFFSPSDFLIVRYENIQQNALKVLKSIYSFLNVDSNFISKSIKTQPKKNSNNKLAIKLERKFSKNKILIYLSDRLNRLLPQNESFFESEQEIRELLNNFYNEHIKLADVESMRHEPIAPDML